MTNLNFIIIVFTFTEDTGKKLKVLFRLFIHTSVIGSAGLGWSGGNCFFVGDVGATETGAPNPLMNIFVIMITINI